MLIIIKPYFFDISRARLLDMNKYGVNTTVYVENNGNNLFYLGMVYESVWKQKRNLRKGESWTFTFSKCTENKFSILFICCKEIIEIITKFKIKLYHQ